MKILIVASGFTGATLPLANHLSRMGNEVKCYNFVQWQSKSIESLDFDGPKRMPSGKPRLLSKSNSLYSYLSSSVDFYILPIWKRKRRLEHYQIGKVFTWLNRRLIKNYVNYIVDEKADYVDLLVHTERELMVADSLKKAGIPFCISYHEVLKKLTGKKELLSVVKESLKYGTPLVLHSQHTANDLIETLGDDSIKRRINIINFGAFESYLSYGEGSCPESLPEKFFLYLGHVHPYKGLKYLYEAIGMIEEEIGDVKIVIAGGGYDPVIDEMKNDRRFVVYNHFIDNVELVGLLRKCQAIVCPYIAASQSGLVQTAMVYEKPVIATSVGAFTEIIHDGVNGLVCKPKNSRSLANSIKRFLSGNIHFCVTEIPEDFKWDKIAQKYLLLFQNQKN